LLKYSVKLKKENKNNFQIILFLISTFLIIFLTISNLRIEAKREELKKEINNLMAQLQILTKRNEELKKNILQVKSESYWEEKAREEGYVKTGEEMIVIKRTGEQKKEILPEGIWQKIINFFQK
jgi:cell division protein FtsB